MRKVGLILPSSNMVVEPAAWRVGPLDVDWHVARAPVSEVGLLAAQRGSFGEEALLRAALLLADAEVDALLFTGLAGMWKGLDFDRGLARRLEDRTGLPATTSLQALVERLHEARIDRIALFSPSAAAVSERFAAELGHAGIEVTATLCMGFETVNDGRFFDRSPGTDTSGMLGSITPETLLTRARPLARASADAIVLLCTNMRSYLIDRPLADIAGRPVLDSIRVSLDAAAQLASRRLDGAAGPRRHDHLAG